MSEKLQQTEEGEEVQANNKTSWHREIGQGIMTAYFIVIAVIYPFYAPGGYVRIGEVKYLFFRNVTLVTIAVMMLVIMASFLGKRCVGRLVELYRHMSVTDWFAYGYFIVVMLSYLCSAYKADALWGADGWYMGVVTQMSFILLYFMVSRFLPCNRKQLAVWLTAAGGVFLLGILNRYSVYPVEMEGQTETFISTLGNINWFCGYWSIMASMGITLYWSSEHRLARAAAGIFSMAAILAGITQGSSSAYLVFLTVFGVLLIFSVQSNRRIYRYLELCMIFAVSCQIGRIMRYMPRFSYNYGNNIYPTGSRMTDLLLNGNAALWLLMGAVLCYGLLRVLEKRCGFRTENCRNGSRIFAAVIVFIIGIGCIVLVMHSGMLHTEKTTETLEAEEGGGEPFNHDWGNGRGAALNSGLKAFESMDAVHKLVGIGPDCFAMYVYEIPELVEQLAEQFGGQRLTNAHNEWLTILVNTGVLGLFCYAGMFMVSIIRYAVKAKEQPLLYVFLVSLLAYTVHNMVSFQQILSTPYVFIVLGIGEGLVCGNRAEDQMRGQDE